MMVACSGCLDFEKETIVAVVSPDLDVARFLLIYEGLHDARSEELKDFVESNQRFYLFSGAFGEVDLSKTSGEKNGQPLPHPLKDQLTIRNEGFFLNQDGRLCEWQTIRVRSLKKTIGVLNQLWSEEVTNNLADKRREIASGGTNNYDLAIMAAEEKAVKGHFPWFEVEPGRISFTMFMASREFETTKMKYADELKQTLAKIFNAATNAPAKEEADERASELKYLTQTIDFFASHSVSLEHRFDRVKISLGVGGGEPIRFVMPQAARQKGTLDQELADYARTLSLPWKEKADAESIIKEFLRQKH